MIKKLLWLRDTTYNIRVGAQKKPSEELKVTMYRLMSFAAPNSEVSELIWHFR